MSFFDFMSRGLRGAGAILAALSFLASAGCDPTIMNEEGERKVVTASDLAIFPASLTLATGASASFEARAGISPYRFELASGVGSLGADGVYLAGSVAGSAIIRVTDAAGATALASVLVYAPLEIAPTITTVPLSGSRVFVASKGVPPYVFSLASGSGAIDASSGAYAASDVAGSAVVLVTDALGDQATASVTISGALLTVSPASVELAPGNQLAFTPSGGVPPYNFAVTSGGGAIAATSGIYTAPGSSGAAQVTVSDSLGNSAVANVTIRPALALSPGSVSVAVGNSFSFTASGGVSPYVFSVPYGGGTVDGSGSYTAPAVAGSAVVLVTDARGNTASSNVTVQPALAISPSAAALGANGVTSFSASGGVPPYSYSVIGAGTVNPLTGSYTAPGGFGNDTVRVTDSRGNVSDAAVAVSNALSISPANITVAAENPIAFSASGGVPPYSFSITGGGGSIVAATGQYTAPTVPGSATIRVTDAALGTSTATVTVNPALAISPTAVTLSVNNPATFVGSGGVGARTFSIQSGAGAINANSGEFTAPPSAGTTVVAITDTIGNVKTATVTIRSQLALNPSTKYLVINSTTTIEPSGGVAPFAFERIAGIGTLDPVTGAFTAPAASGEITTVRVTDSLLNTAVMDVVSVKPVQLASGGKSVCALMDNGTVQCWGANEVGQLGNGTLRDSSYPTQVNGLANVAYLAGASSGNFFCGLIDDGTVSCWGDNSNGQMGIGTSIGAQTTPVQVSGISTATAISLGTSFACALLADTTVTCWGYNSNGQLGDGTVTQRNSPVAAGGGVGNVTAISAGSSHVCVILSDRTARCWGNNNSGQIGNGATSIEPVTAPEVVSDLVNVTHIYAGTSFTCAIDTGKLYCWGTNGYGQLASGDNTPVASPLDTGLTGIARLSVGYGGICAVFDAPTPAVKCWGTNANGAVGDGSTTTRYLPVDVSGLTTASDIVTNGSSAGSFSCALQDSGVVQCWGYNFSGQLGNGASYSVTAPTPVVGLPMSVTEIAVGGTHTCALLTDKTVRCWGTNNAGQLGDGTTNPSITPVVVDGLGDVAAIDAGYIFTCATLVDKTAKCWGYNAHGELGDGTVITRYTPLPVSGLGSIKSLVTGYSHACALLEDKTVWCWGNNTFGELGDGSMTIQKFPVAVPLGEAALAISAGKGTSDRRSTCALLESGGLKCWGSNSYGQLGNGNQTNQPSPVSVVDLSGMKNVLTSGQSSCGVRDSGEVICWGYNASGQLGNGSTVTSYLPNTSVLGLSSPLSVVMGISHACALLPGGGIQCWGSNSRGQVGVGAYGNNYYVPIVVSDSDAFIGIDAAGDRTCGLTTGGVMKCWGSNIYGESGNGIYGGDRLVPVDVKFR